MRVLITILWMLLLPAILCAQEILKVKHYGVDQGLPQSSVWDIQQDSYGFLWISTADGLCRFDGYTFNTFRNDPDDSLSIGGNTTHMMAIDKKGDLWITHDQGLDKYDAAKGNFSSLYHYDVTKNSVFNKSLGEDDQENIWVWIGEGLIKFNKKTNQQIGEFSIEGDDAWRNNQYTHDALMNKGGQIWITLGKPSLVSFNIKTEKFAFVNTGLNMDGLCQVSDSVLLVGTTSGLLRYNTITDNIEKLSFHQLESKIPSTHFQTTKIIHVGGDEFWIGTDLGIFVYHDSQRTFTKHYTSFSGGKENFMFVQTLFKDKSGNIWIGTNGDGLKKHSPKAPPWKHYRSPSDRGDIVKSIYADGHDLVFAGYFNNGFDVFSKTKGLLNKIRKGEAPWFISGDFVYAIAGINASNVFLSFAGNTNTFGIYDHKNETFHDLSSAILKDTGLPNLTGNDFPVAIPFDRETIIFNCRGNLIQASFKDPQAPKFALLNTFPDEVINSVYIDTDKTIWVGTMNGYYVKKTGSKEWQKGNPRLSKQVKTICEDVEGKIWMGTMSGLYILSKEGDIEKTWRTDEPLINDFVYGILRDHYGDMWFSHNKGLTRFDHEKKTFRNFSVDDGLQSNEFNTGAYFKSDSGELFFGGINGTNSFYPEDIQDNLQIPSVQITRIDLNDKPYVADTVHWAQKKLTLDYTNNTLGFEFAGLEFTDPGKNQYAWRMSGIDKDWVFSGNKRFTRYANIPPGDYHFEVKASNNDGIWNETPTVLHIEIIPPFWQTVWFRIIMIAVALGLTAVIATLLSRQRYHRKLMALEMQQKIQYDRDRISRELHDTVGSQLSLISSNLDWVTHPVAPLSESERNKRLDEVSTMSKDVINNLRETIWALKKEEISFSDFTDKLKVIAHHQVAVTPSTMLEFDDQGTDGLILGAEEALHLLRICQEAIHNAVKHAHMDKMEISWLSAHGHYEVRIKDNGQGFNPSDNRSGHYGLENMKQRAAEIHAQFSVETYQGQGTLIIISK